VKVFLTGASSGIGAALAVLYARKFGSRAVLGLSGRDARRLAAVAEKLAPATVVTYALDATDTAALANAAQDFLQLHGTPDLVIANAGVSTATEGHRAEDIPVLQDLLAINTVALAATLQPFVEPMKKAERGKLVGIASITGIRGIPGSGGYSASKAAAIAWLEALRVELRGSRVKVVTICPGAIDTPMTQVNNYYMPFLLSAEEGARHVARAIDSGRSFVIIPWQVSFVFHLLHLMPAWLYDALLAKAPRKPRIGSDPEKG
jgi:short-subunit dehydrogenase